MADVGDFDEFYRGTSARMMRYAYGLTGDLGDAQDVVQEAYVRAWQRWRRLAGYDSAEAWLRLVVTRLATDRWRKLAVRQAAAGLLRMNVPGAPARLPAEETVPLMAAMRTLPVDQRRAIALHYLLDMSVADIAVETGAPLGTVRSWLTRGRAALAQRLGADARLTTADPLATADRQPVNGGSDV